HPGSDMLPFAIARSSPYVNPNSRIAVATITAGTTQRVVRRASRRQGASSERDLPGPRDLLLFVIAGLTRPVSIDADQSSRRACVTGASYLATDAGSVAAGSTNSQRADAKNAPDPW